MSNNLERQGRCILLDSKMEGLFSVEQIEDLYTKKDARFITQGQIQKLASLLIVRDV